MWLFYERKTPNTCPARALQQELPDKLRQYMAVMKREENHKESIPETFTASQVIRLVQQIANDETKATGSHGALRIWLGKRCGHIGLGIGKLLCVAD